MIGKLVNVKFEEELIPCEKAHAKETKSKYPKLPAMILPGEIMIFETTAIARSLARNSPLYKSETEANMALIDSWMELVKSEMEKVYEDVIFPILGHKPYYTKAYKETLASFKAFLPRMNKIEEFIVGKTMTIADIYTAAMLHIAFALIIDEGQRKAFGKLTTWFKKISSDPNYVEFFGIARFCKTALSPIMPPADDEEKAPKKEEKKAEKKAEKTEKDEEDDGDEEGSKKKPPNPLDLLKPSSMVLDDVKREFFLNKTSVTRREYVKEQLWKKFDPEGWALWFIDYIKAEGEGQKLLFTGNLMNGFLQVAQIH